MLYKQALLPTPPQISDLYGFFILLNFLLETAAHILMHVEPLEVYSDDSNFAVVRPPGRNYRGAVVQGDSLATLCRNAIRVSGHPKAAGIPRESQHAMQNLANSLINRMLRCQSVLDAHGIDYPHVHAISEADRVDFDS